MKNGSFKRLVGSAVAGLMCLSALPTVPSSVSFAAQEQDTGTKDGYDWEWWNQGGAGNISMDVGSKGTYSCSWSGIQNVLFRSGRKFKTDTDWKKLGEITVTYEASKYQPNGNSYLCVYGWTRNPLVEYYIVENYGNWRPPGTGQNMSMVGNIEADGGRYEVYSGTHDGPSIDSGVNHFKQYWSVRDAGSLRSKGTISIDRHFDQWENKFNMQMGGLHEVALNVEGYMSSGSATISKNDLYIEHDPEGGGGDPIIVEPLPEGVYINDTFEDGFGGWSSRGSAKIARSSESYYSGGQSMFVSGRKDNWNGAAMELSTSDYPAGSTLSFSSAVMQDTGEDVDIKMTLQYSKGGTDNYDEIAQKTVKSGEWTDLSNTEYTIPSGATNLVLYFEAPNSLIDFYVDDFKLASAGTPSEIKTGSGVVKGQGSSDDPKPSGIRGDFDGDGRITSFDVALSRMKILERFSGTTDPVNVAIADLNGDGDFSIADVLLLHKFVLGDETKFAPPVTTTKAPVVTTTTTTKPKDDPIPSGDYMKSIESKISSNIPGNFTSKRAGVDYGTLETKTYYSKDANGQKKVSVILPPGYNKNKKYPVMYILHGIGGDENSMPGMGVQTMLGNLLADGACEEMILVCPDMMTGPGSRFGFDQASMRYYDLIREDIKNSIMPFMEENYSVATGRENTAITGFSLGGREALYTGVTNSELYGYVGGACPAPGIFKTTDKFMDHEGSLKQTSDFKPSVAPYLLFISAGTGDTVVDNYPESYHSALQQNGVEHLWQLIQGTGHDNSTVNPHLYNFMRFAFKAN